ncbi:MAG TPA: carbon-nitrogen family hydrolase [Terriglobales bacterium]|nr:carbon-nitrogen family hydrolase [Terriglobales bacterium]
MTKVALLQIAIRDDETNDQRLQRGLAMLRNLDRVVQLAILPELWTVGFFAFENYASSATPVPGTASEQLAAAARELKIWLHAGSIVERSNEGIHNTSLLFNPEGRLEARYRKIHLFGYESEEATLLKAGSAPQIAQTPLGAIGLSTCYDLRFPELYRAMSKEGAEIFLVASAWPYPRLEHWLVLNRARAIENLAYVVACNAAGRTRGRQLLGNSVVVDPWGVPIARAGGEEQVLYAQLDRELVHEVRSRFPALTDRRLG